MGLESYVNSIGLYNFIYYLPNDFSNFANQDCFSIDLRNNNLYGCIPISYSALCNQINALNNFCLTDFNGSPIEFETDGNNLDYQVREFCSQGLGSCCSVNYVVPACDNPPFDACEINYESLGASSSISYLGDYKVVSDQLILSAPDSITLYGGFEVPLGKTLEINLDGCN